MSHANPGRSATAPGHPIGSIEDPTPAVSEARKVETVAGEPDATQWSLCELVTRSPTKIALFDRHSRYLAVSRSWQDAWGDGTGSLVGRLHIEAHPELPTHIREAHVQALAGRSVTSDADVVVDAAGLVYYERWSAVPWRRNGESTPAGLVVSIEDLTQVRRLEMMMVGSEVAATTYFEKAATGIVVLSMAGRVQRWNHAYRRFTGRTTAPTDEGLASILHPDDLSEIERRLSLLLEGGGAFSSIRCRHRCADGTFIWVQQSCSVMRNAVGEPNAIAIFVMDISKQLALEARIRIQDRLASVGMLGAGLGHDMQSVLMAIRTQCDLIGRSCACGRPDTATRTARNSIVACVDYLQSLADSLHLLCRDDGDARGGTVDGETAQDVRPARTSEASTELASWWRRTKPLLSKTIHRRISLDVSISRDLPAVAMPQSHMTQVMLNLLANAGRAIEERFGTAISHGRIRIDGAFGVEAHADRKPNQGHDHDMVRLTVSDNGVGMTPDTLRHATEAFFTTRSEARGTGLGLTLVHQLVEQAKGRLELQSTHGSGTTILIELPVRPLSPGDGGEHRSDTCPPDSDEHPHGNPIIEATDLTDHTPLPMPHPDHALPPASQSPAGKFSTRDGGGGGENGGGRTGGKNGAKGRR